MFATLTRSLTGTARKLAFVTSAALVASAVAAAPAQATSPSTFTYSGVSVTLTSSGAVTPTTAEEPMSVSYDPDLDQSTFTFYFDSTNSSEIKLGIDSFSITGVTGIVKNTNANAVPQNTTDWGINLGTAPGDKTTGLTNAAVTLTMHELAAPVITSTISGLPAGVTLDFSDYDYWYYDQVADKTHVDFTVVNSSNSNYTLKLSGATLTHGADTDAAPGITVFTLKKHASTNIYPFQETGLPGDVRYDSHLTITGSLSSVTATTVSSKKLKLPKKYSFSIAAEDIFYDPATKKSSIGLRLLAPANTTSVARFANAKVNGKKAKGELVTEGYEDQTRNKFVFYFYIADIPGDYRYGKSLKVSGKITSELRTTVNQEGINLSSLSGQTQFFVIPAANWIYDAKKKVTKISATFFNGTGASYSVNFSQLTLTTKVKKKGKFKKVTLKTMFKTKSFADVGYAPSFVTGLFEIPGDVRSNSKPIVISGKLTH